MVRLGFYIDVSSKLLHYHFRDCEAKAHATLVYILAHLQTTEELEKLCKIFLPNAYARVLHFSCEDSTGAVYSEIDLDFSSECKFNCVAN